MLVLTRFVARHELKPLERYLSINDVLTGARKILKGLAVETKLPRPVSGLRFFKIRLGGRQSARMIVFVLVENNKVVPLMIRLKKDKVFGTNMAMNDPALVKQVNKNLDEAMADIKAKRYQEFAL
ncbi:MAG: hypothetical protein A2538_04485 [Candidatus Magasanikbacteria bacterium RIFOXYD2_FULL_41_14]|uniref:Type II toxin-antitoxin system RelE/ParE family toxin n=1 Tax=Candidatus Magasanikbacteria bacterium RIFOXYD2_FULL_41_14 TaxID=1798709 RepID=A0A1F6PES9_9BACT|nr:MAG: hypothetical protein A2538_04485 [Candidatus Magasanikbacteria bacterium RIFOXYD2_FULL_41_14]